MKKKILVAVFLAAVILATPLVCAKPASEKNNDKFEYFDLIATGLPDENSDKSWTTPPNADESEIKTDHSRGGGWITWPSPELTVGDKTFDWLNFLSLFLVFLLLCDIYKRLLLPELRLNP